MNIRYITYCIIAFTSISFCKAQEYKTIDRDVYLDKTQACILSQVAGVLSGYEFVGGNDPYIGMPDEWFHLCKGPYGGGEKHGSAGENFVEANGRIFSDDDYHIDFFTQLIYDKIGVHPSYSDITDMWVLHQVNDWGGGYSAMNIMNNRGFIPPFVGRLEYGNNLGWCTEAYIENETVGCIYPGMPLMASVMSNRFASVTGDFDSQLLGKFYGTAYSLAYFETDATEVLRKASVVLPVGSWARQMYDLAFALHKKYPTDWRTAAKELYQSRRDIFLMDNIQTAYDVNGGFTVLAILYGNNDYYETMKIASLIGYDGDCTAATAAGLLGIIKGMKGLPKEVNEVVWRDGEGVYINNKNNVPHIRKNYPDEQKFADLAKLYQQNAEKIITYNGGEVTGNQYRIKVQDIPVSKALYIENADFEAGDKQVNVEEKAGAQVVVSSNIPAHNGKSFARILTNKISSEGKAYFKVSGLKAGSIYKLSAYLATSGRSAARLYAKGDRTPYIYASVFGSNNNWYYRSLIFTAQDSEMEVGLHGINDTGNTLNYYLDDLCLEEYPIEVMKTYEAEDLKSSDAEVVEHTEASAGKYLKPDAGQSLSGIDIEVDRTDDYILRLRYANTGTVMVSASLSTPETGLGKIGFPVTGSEVSFSGNYVDMPVRLNKGVNKLRIEHFSDPIQLDKIELVGSEEFGYTVDQSGTSVENISDASSPFTYSFCNDTCLLSINYNAQLPARLSVYNMNGIMLKSQILNDRFSHIDLSDIRDSLLLINVSSDNVYKTVKLIKHS